MSRLDATAGAFVDDATVIRPVTFLFLDFDGDPLRANDSGMDISISGQSQPDLNGLYKGVTGDFAELSPIRVAEGGSSPVSAKLSGLKGIDDEVLDIIGDETKWKGRLARVWRVIWDQGGNLQGTWQHFYTGYMVDVLIAGSTAEQFIEITIESYLAVFSQASNRTYLNSRDFDPGDHSGDAALSAANGSGPMPGSVSGGQVRIGGGGGLGGGFFNGAHDTREL